ncbi:MAG: class II aldolase/adducin family protein [Bacillota bacterium]|jgi:L-ribulose-5-phosphate 4-epimerase|nr:class II aldolase/adducin family protein [Bacillota bacterium]HOB91568.1 class II aldolase/adducin family protein [Bacillota bacterium]HPZ54722.1 class II aldolase/adducin family protein [Bacillota bacterium]HQD17887.1 class II aldolase/adducin family protein [Bacillota bacterium]
MLLEAIRSTVIETARRARRDRLVHSTFGNFSIRDRDTGYVCITPSGLDYDSLTPSDIVVVDLDGRTVDGNRRPSIETPLHTEVYKRRKDVMAVVHTHSAYATAWACCRKDVPVVLAEVAAAAGGPIKCAPYRPMGSSELAVVTADALGDSAIVLMASHGVLAVGPTMDSAYNNAVIAEEGARIALYANLIGEAVAISEEECVSLVRIARDKYGQDA